MFVRVKKIKGNNYAYLVQNEWTPWGSRQRVTKYLGKTHTPTRYSEETTPLPAGMKETITAAVVQELKNHGFVYNGGILRSEELTVNLHDNTVRLKNKNAVLALNEGYLCDHTLNQLLSFSPEEHPDKNAKKLANLVLETGLKLSHEQFVHLFEQTKQHPQNIKEATRLGERS